MTRAFGFALLMAQAFVAFVSPARAGGGMTAADVPSPPAAMTAAAMPPAIADSASSTDGCLPYEARNRAIPPRPRVSASALITRSAP